MLLLTATAETQGQMPGDVCDAVEGELVVAFADCHIRAHEDHLMRCKEGCPPRFFGLSTNERTTTAMVRDVGISRDDYLLAMTGYAESRGSRSPVSLACVLATRSLDRAVTFLPGTVLSFAAGKLSARREADSTWRDLVTGASCMARSFAWRCHFDRTIRALHQAQESS